MSNYELSAERFAAMPALKDVIAHPVFQECMERIADFEQDRIFCKHDMSHMLDVARIAYIANLEDGEGIPKEVIYAIAFLHDLGRAEQYKNGTPHDEAGAAIARKILQNNSYFSEQEKQEIVQAISAHRSVSSEMTPLQRILYRADKSSRACYMCDAQDACNWPRGKMNIDIRI